MIGDYATKPLQRALFRKFRDQIMGVTLTQDPGPGKTDGGVSKTETNKSKPKRQGYTFGTVREIGGTTGVCWESNPGPREGGTRAREKDCRSYDIQPVKGKEWILCSRSTRGNA
jgi:hypothetical protein